MKIDRLFTKLCFFVLLSLFLCLNFFSCSCNKSSQPSQRKSDNVNNKEAISSQEGNLNMQIHRSNLIGDKTIEVDFALADSNKAADLTKFKLRITFVQLGDGSLTYTDANNIVKTITSSLEESLIHFFSTRKLEPNKGGLKIKCNLVPDSQVTSLEIKFELLDAQNKVLKEDKWTWQSIPADVKLKLVPLGITKLSGADRLIQFKLEKEANSAVVDFNKLQLIIKEDFEGKAAVTYQGKAVTSLSGLELSAIGEIITLTIEPGLAISALFKLQLLYDDNKMGPVSLFRWIKSDTEPNQELVETVLVGDQAKVKKLLQVSDTNLNTINSNSEKTLLQIALGRQYKELREALLQAPNTDINIPDKSGFTPLHIAVLVEDPVAIRSLVSKAVNINAQNDDGLTPLHIAIQQQNLLIVQELLSVKTIDVNAKDSWNMTPLHMAAQKGDIDIFKELVSKGANVNAQNMFHITPLYLAVDTNNQVIVEELLKSTEIDVNVKIGQLSQIQSEDSILHKAVRQANTLIIEALLKRGADINIINGYERTPLHIAVENGDQSVIELLLRTKGININAKDAWYKTPLYLAVERKHQTAVKALLSKGVNVNLNAINGYTPLSEAVKTGNIAILKLLLQVPGIDINAHSNVTADTQINIDGNTPLHLAIESDNATIVKMLLEQGARQDVKNIADKTACDLAQQSTNQEIKKLFGLGS